MNVGFSAYFVKKENIFSFFEKALEKGIFLFELAFEIPYLEIMDANFLKKIESLKEKGASFSLHGPWIECNPGSLFKKIREFSRERILRAIDVASDYGLNPLIIHPGFNFFGDEEAKKISENYFLEELSFLVSHSQKKGVQLLIENVPFALSFFNEIEDLQKIKEKISVGVCYDLGHALISKRKKESQEIEESIISEISKNMDNIGEIHFHNNFGSIDDHLLYSGIMNLQKMLKSLEKIGFEGPIIIESTDVEMHGIEYLVDWVQGKIKPSE